MLIVCPKYIIVGLFCRIVPVSLARLPRQSITHFKQKGSIRTKPKHQLGLLQDTGGFYRIAPASDSGWCVWRLRPPGGSRTPGASPGGDRREVELV